MSTQASLRQRDPLPPGSPRAPFSSKLWRVSFDAQGVHVDLRGATEREASTDDIYEISGMFGSGEFHASLPLGLLDALLARAPDPTRMADLAAADAALLLEHLLTGPLEALEQALGARVSLDAITPQGARRRFGEIPLIARALDVDHPVGLAAQDSAALARLANEIAKLVERGPAADPGRLVALGPIHLASEDVEELQVGDHLLLEGASAALLRGVVYFDETSAWPIEIVDGVLKSAGKLHDLPDPDAEQRRGLASLYLRVGVTTSASAMQPGDKIGMQRLDDAKMLLLLAGQPIGVGGLVSRPEGICVRVVARGNG